MDTQIPSKAVSPDGADLVQPLRALLEDLELLANAGDRQKAQDGGITGAFSGTPASVGVIKAGATAAAKGWAAGLGTVAAAVWAGVAAWYPKQGDGEQMVVLGGAALITAAVAIGISYLMASDVRGRAAATVSQLEARASVAVRMLEAAQAVYEPRATGDAAPELIPLPSAVSVKNQRVGAADEQGWQALALERHSDGTLKFLVVKGSDKDTLEASDLDFG